MRKNSSNTLAITLTTMTALLGIAATTMTASATPFFLDESTPLLQGQHQIPQPQTSQQIPQPQQQSSQQQAPQIITEFYYVGDNGNHPEVIPLSPEAIQYQKTDPVFAQLARLVNQCIDFTNQVELKRGGHIPMAANDINDNHKSSCDALITQGVSQLCSFAVSDVVECSAAQNMQLIYTLASYR